MKKFFVMALALVMLALCTASGESETSSGTKDNDNTSDASESVAGVVIDDDDNEGTESEDSNTPQFEFPDFSGEDTFVLIAKEDCDVTISSKDQFNDYTVGFSKSNDSMYYAYYNSFKSCVPFGSSHDSYAALDSGNVDFIIVSEQVVKEYYKVLWTFEKIENP